MDCREGSLEIACVQRRKSCVPAFKFHYQALQYQALPGFTRSGPVTSFRSTGRPNLWDSHYVVLTQAHTCKIQDFL